MLTEAKGQFDILLLTVKYNVMREMTNKVSFTTNVLFMMLNNSTFIIQWIILFHLKKEIGGYGMREIMLLWALAASSYGFAHIFFHRAFSLSELITEGKLDAFLVQPKNVLLSVISSTTSPPAMGDLLYGFVLVFFTGISVRRLFLFTLFTITGGLLYTAFAVAAGSLSFWITRGDLLAVNLTNTMINFSTYPDGIFKGVIKVALYTLIPIGFYIYLPVKVILLPKLLSLLWVLLAVTIVTGIAFFLFYKGLRRYSSGNLMSARI